MVDGHGSEKSQMTARRMLALSMHLSPRNAFVQETNRQLVQGKLPDLVRMDYAPDLLARLLQMRAELLLESKAEKDVQLGRYFLHCAYGMGERSEELKMLYREDHEKHGALDWRLLTGSEK